LKEENLEKCMTEDLQQLKLKERNDFR